MGVLGRRGPVENLAACKGAHFRPVLHQNDDQFSRVLNPFLSFIYEEENKTFTPLLTYEGKPPYYTGPRQNLAGYHKTAKFVRMVMFFDEIVYIASPCQFMLTSVNNGI